MQWTRHSQGWALALGLVTLVGCGSGSTVATVTPGDTPATQADAPESTALLPVQTFSTANDVVEFSTIPERTVTIDALTRSIIRLTIITERTEDEPVFVEFRGVLTDDDSTAVGPITIAGDEAGTVSGSIEGVDIEVIDIGRRRIRITGTLEPGDYELIFSDPFVFPADDEDRRYSLRGFVI